MLPACFPCYSRISLVPRLTKTETISWSRPREPRVCAQRTMGIRCQLSMEKKSWRPETFFTPLEHFLGNICSGHISHFFKHPCYIQYVLQDPSTLQLSVILCATLYPISPFTSFLHLPLPLHHHCLHHHQQGWQWSHRGHLTDSISAIFKSSSGVTGIISLCVL